MNQIARIRSMANRMLDTVDRCPTPAVLAAFAQIPEDTHRALCLTLRHTNDDTARAAFIHAGIA